MMDTEQMQAEFLRRYEDIVASGDTRQMERLGEMSMILSDDGEMLRRGHSEPPGEQRGDAGGGVSVGTRPAERPRRAVQHPQIL